MGAFYENFLNGLEDHFEQKAVWEKGAAVPGYDPNTYRKDVYGSWMQRSEYGNCLSTFGWEIDHIIPVERGGSDDLTNKQPLQWANNRRKGRQATSLRFELRKIFR